MQEFWVHEQQTNQLFVVGTLLGAQLILDTYVTLPSYDGGLGHVMSSKEAHL
jgi:hypothetical protein